MDSSLRSIARHLTPSGCLVVDAQGMATFVIVHGGWGGGWEWTEVARALRRAGHEVFTPTLTGMGERAHLAGDQPVGLAIHIEDIVAVLRLEDLGDVVLCGHSYGGMPSPVLPIDAPIAYHSLSISTRWFLATASRPWTSCLHCSAISSGPRLLSTGRSRVCQSRLRYCPRRT